ncbi:MAG: indolepyruvate ferredoxin oxidoreductase family protein [Beijerinckiaceae bacterium]|jgi:indolepyruvate ferredoxin oxidoreductase
MTDRFSGSRRDEGFRADDSASGGTEFGPRFSFSGAKGAAALRAIVQPRPDLSTTTLADKFDLRKDRIFVSGAQAVVRLLLMQREIDRRAGHDTAGFVSGYRGSPLGRLDSNLFSAKKVLDAAAITFEPGLNEDLAATAVWGAQQAEMRGEGRYDGVFSLWYGKGPGVDRSGDVFRHANLAGTSALGGVLALMGDDHLAESSSTAHQSEFIFADMMMPILSPAGVQEIIDYGLMGIAMSRYTGTWTGIKCVKDTIESTASIDASLDRFSYQLPLDVALPPGGLNIRPNDSVLDQDVRLTRDKLAAIHGFLRANKLNKIILSGGPKARLGIVTVGKAYLDVRQALEALGIDEVKANAYGIRLYKLACPWPVEPEGLKAFAEGLETIMVVEEKRSLIETQVREQLYGLAQRPVCIGKADETGAPLFPPHGALDINDIAIAIGRRIMRHTPNIDLAKLLDRLERIQGAVRGLTDIASRTPYFCSGCPHNSSTAVPEGSRAYAGIGCHYMVQAMDRGTEGFTQMGGEGANWIGEAPFSKRGHVFQNLGDGTYNHSGTLAIRWAVAAKTNITYKILFNDAVAMTGGQSHEGGLTVDMIARQVAAEGVKTIAIVSDEPGKYPASIRWPEGVTIEGRENLDTVQKALAEVQGPSVLIYDQTCAAEMRRRRKKGTMPDPDLRVVINELACEGCGDCGVTSNCVSIQPLETEFGRKRVIDQTSCNKDTSCVSGFCPAIVTVSGAQPKKLAPQTAEGLRPLPPRRAPAPLTSKPYSIVVTGVGGTGVVTIGAILGMAAHLEGRGCGIMDMAGLAQKGGSVYSHIKIAERPQDIHAIRIAAGEADVILGCDIVATGSKSVLATIRRDSTAMVVNSAEIFPGEFTRNPNYDLPTARLKQAINLAAGTSVSYLDATGIASALLGTSLAGNMFALGFAWQQGLIPLSEDSILRAIELNGEAIDMNRQAFAWGRRAAADPAGMAVIAAAAKPGARRNAPAQSFDEIVARRATFLTGYQNAGYAKRYRALVDRAANAETALAPGLTGFAEAVAKGYFKLLAIKDEYEIARLYSDGSFARQMAESFEGDLKITYHLAPPVLARRNKKGVPVKTAFGPWMRKLFPVLAAGKHLRGSLLDPFGYTNERRVERQSIAAYEKLMAELMSGLTHDNHAIAVALAALPESIKGYGHVKERNRLAAKAGEEALLAQWRDGAPALRWAAE